MPEEKKKGKLRKQQKAPHIYATLSRRAPSQCPRRPQNWCNDAFKALSPLIALLFSFSCVKLVHYNIWSSNQLSEMGAIVGTTASLLSPASILLASSYLDCLSDCPGHSGHQSGHVHKSRQHCL